MSNKNFKKNLKEILGIGLIVLSSNCASLQTKNDVPAWITNTPENCAVGYSNKSGNTALDLEQARFAARTNLFRKLNPGKTSGYLSAMQQDAYEDGSKLYVLMCQRQSKY